MAYRRFLDSLSIHGQLSLLISTFLSAMFIFAFTAFCLSSPKTTGYIQSAFYIISGIVALLAILIGILIYRSIQLTLLAQQTAEEELQRTAERLQIAQKSANVGIWDFEFSTHLVTWSPELSTLYGLNPDTTVPSIELWTSILHPDDRESLLPSIENTLLTGKMGTYEYRVVHPNGEVRWISTWGTTTFSDDRKPIRISGISLDITEKKRLEEKLRAAIEARDDFIAVASHELKNPLAGLQMQLQLLDRVLSQETKPVDPRINLLVQGAVQSLSTFSKLLDDLLDLTRIRGGQLSLNRQKVNLRENILESIHQLENEANKEGNSITLHAGDSVEGEWDPTRLHQVFINLISNAIKYGNHKPIEIQISSDPSKKIARVQVTDQGIGMTPEIQKKIFQRFQRGVPGDNIKGLGLGLYITREIIEAHRGTIQVNSQLKKGSVFTIELPLESEPKAG